MNHSLRAYWFGIVFITISVSSSNFALAGDSSDRNILPAHQKAERCTPFDSKSIRVVKIRGLWKLIDRKRVIHNFKYKKKQAKTTLSVIRKRNFSWMCVIPGMYPPFIYFIPESQVTKVIVVRHAEKATNSNALGVELSVEGEKRAITLSNILNVSGVSAAFSTKTPSGQTYVRTFETVNNYAESKGFDVQYYKTAEEIVELIKEQYSGQSVLVAGHTSTVPEILEGLGIDNPPAINGQFNNLFVVFLMSDDTSSMIRLKYEVHSNLD